MSLLLQAATDAGTLQWRLVSLAPWGRIGSVLAVAAALAIVVVSWLQTRHEPRRRKIVLLALRAGALGAALMLFFQPAVELENVTHVPNHVAVIVDSSESMGLGEAEGEASRSARLARWIDAQRPALEALRAQHKVDFYTFAEGLEASTEAQVKMGVRPRGEATRLRESLAQLRARYEGRDLGGVIVFSDGADNGRLGEAAGGVTEPHPVDGEARDFLAALDTPVHTGWVGRKGLSDIAIARVLADDFAFVRTAVQIEAVVRVTGKAFAGRTLPVTLRRDGAVVRTIDVPVRDEGGDHRVTFAFTPDRVGSYVYEVSTPLVEGEAVKENNRRAFVLRVIRDRIRVLLVAGRPSWDERFLRGLLKHDPNVDLISFFILRTPTDLELVPPEELSLIPFPTDELFREQLRSFDVVLLQNFNYGPYGIGGYLQEVRRYVEDGGGLAMIGGDLSFSSGGYAESPLADVLPVELLPPEGPPERLIDVRPFRVKLSNEGRRHPVTALKLDVEENQRRWAELPELIGTNLVARARPNATVLMTHPTLHGADGKPLPVLAVTEAGKGRTLAITSDSSWRWGFGVPSAVSEGAANSTPAASSSSSESETSGDRGRAYQRFWESTIRWLIHDPSLSFLRVEPSEVEYGRGQKVVIDVRALGPDYQPSPNVEVRLQLARIRSGDEPDAPAAPIARTGKTDSEGQLHVELDPLPSGGYRASASATLGGRQVDGEAVFVVRGAGRELEAPEARDDVLRQVASITGGRFLSEGESLAGLQFHPPRVARVNKHRSVELWSNWWVLLLASGCLGAYWALRRKWGYR